MDSVPKTIFKYEAFTLQSLRNLKCQSVYFGSPKNFNDPYDSAVGFEVSELADIDIPLMFDHLLESLELSDAIKRILPSVPVEHRTQQLLAGIKDAVSNAREKYISNCGVTCFSECNDNLLMWSHYGGSYRGFCLEFRTDFEPFTTLKKVNYSQSFPKIDPVEFVTRLDFEQVIRLFCTKSDCWRYEREWRAIHQVAGTVFTYEPTALKSIYFGTDIDVQDRDLVSQIMAAQNPEVNLFLGTRSEIEFKVEFEEHEYQTLAYAKSSPNRC